MKPLPRPPFAPPPPPPISPSNRPISSSFAGINSQVPKNGMEAAGHSIYAKVHPKPAASIHNKQSCKIRRYPHAPNLMGLGREKVSRVHLAIRPDTVLLTALLWSLVCK